MFQSREFSKGGRAAELLGATSPLYVWAGARGTRDRQGNRDHDYDSGCGCLTCLSDSGGDGKPTPTDSQTATFTVADEPTRAITVSGSLSGIIGTSGDTDIITVSLVAGQTYMISLRGTGTTPLSDAYLTVKTPSGTTVGIDDDGGIVRDSLFTFTASVTGTYQIIAEGYPGDGVTGGYTVDVRQRASDSVGSTIGTATPVAVGATTFGFVEASKDVDMYSVTLDAGGVYSISLAGGADYNTDPSRVPAGELDTRITIYNAAGVLVASNDDVAYPDDVSSALTFIPETGGTYYVKVDSYSGQTGGYVLEVEEIDLSSLNPLDSIDWGTQLPSNNVSVYFAPSGQTFDGVTSLGWTQYEKDQAMAALQTWAQVSNLTFTVTTNSSTATFKLVTTTSDQYLGYFNPPGTTNAGVGVFATNGSGWNTTGGLAPGGYGFITLVHEFGHGLGLAHPHDNGGGSEVMPGVTSPFDSFGVYDLNQGVYTTMSYNDGWQLHPNGPVAGLNYGYQAGPGAFDVALIQIKYGASSFNTGDNVYVLPTANAAGAFWDIIWDTGGTDSIVHNGTVAATIDLTAATLDYSATGAGVISFVNGIYGGFTIAAGVIIENASGGSGADTIIGNSANNTLDGGAGNDVIIGGAGDDFIRSGVGSDQLQGNEGTDTFYMGAALSAADMLDGGEGLDQLGLQGNYALTFTANHLLNIESIGLLSSQDNRFGGGSGSPSVLYSYNLTTIDANVQAAQTLKLNWNNLQFGENVYFNGSAELNGSFMIYAGFGTDTILGGAGNDGFFFGAGGRFTAADRIDGGAGLNDQVGIRGDYSQQINFGADTIKNIEVFVVLSAHDTRFGAAGVSYSYNLKTHDANVAAGQTLTVTGTSLRASETFIFDGSSETDGRFSIRGGAGADQLTGGANADQLFGGLGPDVLTGGGGGDTFLYRSTAESTLASLDRIVDFSAGDKIDLSNIDADLTSDGNQAFRLVTGAFTGSAGEMYAQYNSQANTTYVYMDVDGDGIADMILSLSGNISLIGTDFVL